MNLPPAFGGSLPKKWEEQLMASRFAVAFGSAILISTSPVLAQSQTDSAIPTIPESQIEPRTLSSSYEFLSTADAFSEFQLQAGRLALEKAESDTVKTLAQEMIDRHTEAQATLRMAGEADDTEIAAASPDGEQQGLLSNMEPLTGADFDRLYVESQLFAHQRAIAVFKGYTEGDGNLNRFAAETLPVLSSNYATLLDAANELQISQNTVQ